MFKTKWETEFFLKKYADNMGFISINQAASYIVDNYEDYDYNGHDRIFLAHCEDIKEEKPGHQLTKYTGLIETYFETGMEGLSFIFHDDRGNHEGPKYNNPNETMTYRSLEWALIFHKDCLHFIKIFNNDGQLIYEGKLTRDLGKIANHNYKYHFLPMEIDEEDWFEYCHNEYRAELWTNEVPLAIRQKLNMKFTVGSLVWDDLTNKKTIVKNITFTYDRDEPSAVGYWVDNDHLNGGRLPWELSELTTEQMLGDS